MNIKSLGRTPGLFLARGEPQMGGTGWNNCVRQHRKLQLCVLFTDDAALELDVGPAVSRACGPQLLRSWATLRAEAAVRGYCDCAQSHPTGALTGRSPWR